MPNGERHFVSQYETSPDKNVLNKSPLIESIYLSIMNWRIPSLKPQITEFFVASFKSHCCSPGSTEPSHVQGDLGSGPRAV